MKKKARKLPKYITDLLYTTPPAPVELCVPERKKIMSYDSIYLDLLTLTKTELEKENYICIQFDEIPNIKDKNISNFRLTMMYLNPIKLPSDLLLLDQISFN